MDETFPSLQSRIDPSRLRDLTLDLVRIPSPTGDCGNVARHYAMLLREAGVAADVVHHDEHPGSPSVVGRLAGRRSGPTLQLDGHLDTIHAAHSKPRLERERIHGRGAADMKSGLAVMAEVARVLCKAGSDFAGELLITAHGMHEAPWGRGETLRLLIDEGYVGDAAICVEGAHNELAIVGKGLGIFELTIRRPGGAVHELAATPDVPHPALVGHRIVGELLDQNARFVSTQLPYGLGSESFFVGVFESGDFYNRVPVECRMVGTRRYAPEAQFQAVDEDFRGVVARVANETGAAIDVSFWSQRDGFEVDPSAPLVTALQHAYQSAHGRELPLSGMHYVADNSIFVREAGIRALQYGTGLGRAHADEEWVDLSDVADTARVLLLAALEYLVEPTYQSAE